MRGLLFIHLFSLGMWLGGVVVEAIIEIVAARSPETRPAVTKCHYYIDLFFEIPAFMAVLISGLLLLDTRHLDGWLGLKMMLGLLAIAINMICVSSVLRRKWALDRGDKAAVSRHARHIFLEFGIGVPAGLSAFVIGLHLLNFF